jgi:hypothetical protein
MTPSVRVFVNGVGVDVPPGTTALDAVRGWDAASADAVDRGERIITDSRGLPASPATPVQAGAIFRVISGRGRRPVATQDESEAP